MHDETELLLTVPADAAGERLDRYLADHLEAVSRSQVQRAIRLGLVAIDGIAAHKSGLALREGQELSFQPPPQEPVRAEPEAIPLDVLYEDEALVVVNKAAGMVVHPAAGHPGGTLVNALLGRDPALGRLGPLRPGIVHRLDKGTSGCIVVARTARAREALAEQFLERTLFKGYVALTLGCPGADAGRIERPIARHPTDRKRFTSRLAEGRHAETRWSVFARGLGLGCLGIRILTGRTHQIRVHLADDGFPVAADDLYGPGWEKRPVATNPELREAFAEGPLLHAACLRFRHPVTGRDVCAVAPLPGRFTRLLDAMGEGLAAALEAHLGNPTFFGGESP